MHRRFDDHILDFKVHDFVPKHSLSMNTFATSTAHEKLQNLYSYSLHIELK